jgi:four helix bundle protein
MADDLRERTFPFALQVVRFYGSLPRCQEAYVLGRQFLKSGTHVGAAYREGKRAKSNADLVSKLEGALQELDESDYWLKLIVAAELTEAAIAEPILCEIEELTAIFVTIVKKVRARPDR